MESQGRLVVTLGPEAAQATRNLATRAGLKAPEVVRRGLSLYQMLVELAEDEELVIRNQTDGSLERVRFQWFLG